MELAQRAFNVAYHWTSKVKFGMSVESTYVGTRWLECEKECLPYPPYELPGQQPHVPPVFNSQCPSRLNQGHRASQCHRGLSRILRLSHRMCFRWISLLIRRRRRIQFHQKAYWQSATSLALQTAFHCRGPLTSEAIVGYRRSSRSISTLESLGPPCYEMIASSYS